MRSPFTVLLALLGLLLLPSLHCAWAQGSSGEERGTPSAPEKGAGEIKSYTPELRGDLDDKLRELVQQTLDSFSLKEQPPRSANLLRRRMRDDLKLLRGIMESRGYFKADLDRALTGPAATPTAVFSVTTGPRFHFRDLHIDLAPITPEDATSLPLPADVGLERGAPYSSTAVLDAEKGILAYLGARGRPFPEIGERTIVANHDDNSVDVRFSITPGPLAVFGTTEVQGLEHVNAEFVLMQLPWRQGDTFDAGLLDKAQVKLLNTGLFAVVTFDKGQVSEDGELPIVVTTTERLPRTFRAGLRYRTDTGPGGKVEWEHRTLLGRGEHLRLEMDADTTKQEFKASFRKPAFMHEKLSLLLESSTARERQDAYDSDSTEATAGLEYAVTDRLTLGAGVAYRLSDVHDRAKRDIFGLVSFPASLRHDTRDDVLDPGSGGLLACYFTPYADTLGNASSFIKTQAGYSHYLQLLPEKRLVLALRALLGVSAMTGGKGLDGIPADVRYYAGGGGSIRGYAYKSAGDLDISDDPIGGRSLLETAAELRWRFMEDFGLVAFIDAGRAYEQSFPDFGQQLFIGAGAGLRYYSPLGPIGLDVAFPLNRRKGVDDFLQLYISLGQSF
jgi:translocation and assembly module TamA